MLKILSFFLSPSSSSRCRLVRTLRYMADSFHNRYSKQRRQNQHSGISNPSSSNVNNFNPTHLAAQSMQRRGGVIVRADIIARAEQAATDAYRGLLSTGESVTVWKLTQSVFSALKIDSLESLGLRVQDIPCLYKIILLEGKLNAFVHCYVAVRRIATLHDLSTEICRHEGVEEFEGLGLGPLIQHPLVVHYFAPPADTVAAFKITTEQIISYLSVFMYREKDIRVEEFLSFVAKKESASFPAQLCIRIQSLGMHIGFIRRTRRVENDLRRQIEAESGKKIDIKRRNQVSASESNIISERFGSFPSSNNETTVSGPKQTRFETVSSSDDDEDIAVRNTSVRLPLKRNLDLQCEKSGGSCLYPLEAEELALLGKQLSAEKEINCTNVFSNDDEDLGGKSLDISGRKKRKVLQQKKSLACRPFNLTEEEHAMLEKKLSTIESKYVTTVLLKDDDLKIFIAAWKDICREHSVYEVLKRMMKSEWTLSKKGLNRIRKLFTLFTTQPAIGLLNVAVMAMKMELWDSLYGTFQEINKQEVRKTETANVSGGIDVGLSREAAAVPSFKEESHASVSENGLSTDEVLQHVKFFFEQYSTGNNESGELATEKWFMALRKIWDCEKWLMKQFSIKDFTLLGFGDFLDFFRSHISEFPDKIIKNLVVHKQENLPLTAYIVKNQLLELLSQATWDLGDNAMLTSEGVNVILHKQFPSIRFELSDSYSFEEILNYIRKFQNYSEQKKTRYSAALLARSSISDQSSLSSAISENWTSEPVQIAGPFGHMTSADALKCLLKAPMLSDLEEWSHWDHVFAPTLGPILNWLDKEGISNDLLCLVLRSGKVVRIDGSATMENFLAAAVKGSAKKTSTLIVSIVSLYGGIHHAPIALMKSHACQAIDILVKNCVDCFDYTTFMPLDKSENCINCKKSQQREMNVHDVSVHASVLGKPHIVHDYNERSQKVDQTTQAIRVASRFILDCLVCIPSEFRTFAVNIFLSGLSTLAADASQVLLQECVSYDERVVLHEIGLSNGIIDWIKDYQLFSFDAEHSDMSEECHEPKSTVQNNGQFDTERKYGTHQLEVIHFSDLDTIKRKEESLDGLQLEHFDDQNSSGAMSKDCDNCMPRSEGLAIDGLIQISDKRIQDEDGRIIIEAIRRDEFGLDLELECNESRLLKKQHARLSRALHCLSEELYSQDFHFLLELVQNADDNCYPAHVEPTLAFILRSTGVVVLNNELGFTAENIRALCDVGNSTKKGANAGYIGQKGIGFKSVFRVTDSPEIHSNGFHMKFDITEGELGFILPTLVPPLGNLELLSRELAIGNENLEGPVWNTCIVLPFKGSLVEGTGMRSWASKFADLHPSLLLFLHRLRCIKVRDSLTNSLMIMRREDIGNGLVKVSHGKESTTWLMASRKLNVGTMRPGIQSTEIAMAFTLCKDSSGEFVPYLEQQPVFAFLPLRAYGLKFILQGDFILPSSREEVDGDSAWNQWLLSEFPELFVNAAESFTSLHCYQSNPGKAVSLYMSFVPLVGEVLGLFSPLPRMILSKLQVSPCLPLEGKDKRWALPCKVLRGWNDQIRILLPDDLINRHLGIGYLQRDVFLSDPLAASLGVHTFGPRILIDLMKSMCNRGDDFKSLGLNWIGSWLVALCECLSCQPTGRESFFQVNSESDFLSDLAQIRFIPLSDGSYSSVREDSIWLPCEDTRSGVDGTHILKNFPKLYCELRTVHPSLLFSPTVSGDVVMRDDADVILRMLRRVGVGQLSAHEVVMKHILPAMTNFECLTKDKLNLAEYMAFIMIHLQSNCSLCHLERPKLILELQKEALIITNNGYIRAGSEPLHFSREFGNPADMNKVLAGTNVIWNEIDSVYLQFSSNEVGSLNVLQWRKFFTELGVTDLMQVVNIEKKLQDRSCSIWKHLAWERNVDSVGWTVKDWESPELVDILTVLSSSSTYVDQCSHFLEVLDSVWDDLYGAKKSTYCCGSPGGKEGKYTESSCILKIREYCWVKSRLDGKLYFPSDLFFDCDEVRSILGSNAPYATPQVHSRKFVADIGFRTQVSVKDALSLLSKWSKSECMFKASTSQMGRVYSFLWTSMDTCRDEIVAHFRKNSSIFVPLMDDSNQESITPGMFLLLDQVYWKDPTGCLDLLAKGTLSSAKISATDKMCLRALCQIYPNLHGFFVTECCVQRSPDFDGYLRILKHLASIALPSEVYEEVMQVFYLWAEGIETEQIDSKEISRWKDCLHDLGNSVLPTMQDKWVSLHPNFGLVCWYDNAEIGEQFKHCNGVYFLCVDAGGKRKKTKAKDKVRAKLITFMRAMGISSLSEVVVREAIFYGVQDNEKLFSLINWILPYAQRYLYKMHPEVFHALKDNIFNNQLKQLHLLVVEELFYRHTLQGCHTVSNKRHECNSLLQGSTLYMSRTADFSAIYSELSRLFFNGCVDLQLVNFLHLITIMAETGSTVEQTESFILNAQRIPKLPLEEVTWFCEHRGDKIDKHPILSKPSLPENQLMTKKPQKISVAASWPPTTWKGVPKSRDEVQAQAVNSVINRDSARHEHGSVIDNIPVSHTNSACESNLFIDASSASAIAECDMDMKRVKFGGERAIASNDNLFLGSSLTGLEYANINKSYELSALNEMDIGTSNVLSNRDQLCLGVTDDEQQQLTGRLGERVVYKYLIDKYGPASVNWVNENGETGLAYDIILSKENGKKEFIEVKATRSENKDWFEITNQEWDLASKNSDCFTIIRVFLGSNPYVKLFMLPNPIKLCQQKILKLAILMPINKHCALPEVTFIPQREEGD